MLAVYKKALHDSRRFAFWMAVSIVLYVLLIMAFYPSMIEQSEEMDKLIESYPKEMLSMIYGGDVETLSISDPGNYVQSQFLTWLELLLGGIVIVQAFNALTNAERDGTLDVMLSLPVARRTYLLARIFNSITIILILLVACWLSLVLSTFIWPEFDVAWDRLALSMLGGFFPTMVISGFAYLVAAVVPSSKHYSGPLAYLFLFGSYLLYGLVIMVNSLKGLKPVFVFHYYNGGVIIRQGVDIGNWVLLGAVALIYFALAWWLVEKKELGV